VKHADHTSLGIRQPSPVGQHRHSRWPERAL